MKNRFISAILLFVFMLSLTACGNGGFATDILSDVTELQLSDQQEKQDDTESAAKSLSISVCWDHYNIDEAVKKFKQIHPDVEITVHKYANDDEKYKAQIVTNLMAGTSDDIMDGTGLPYLKLADSGLLAGFYPLMENDSNFNKNDYYENVFEALNYKKEMYVFPVNFAYGMTGVNNTIGAELVSEFRQHKTIADSERLKLYTESKNKSGFYVDENFNVLNVIANNIDQFIDYENKKCDFNSEEFINLITDVKNVTELNKPEKSPTFGMMPQQDALSAKKYFFKNITTGRYEYFLPYKEFDDFVSFIPTANNEGRVYIYPTMRFCISEASKNKELAWEFLKFLTLPETNRDISFGNMFSVNKQTFKEKTTSSIENSIKDLETQSNLYLKGDRKAHVDKVIAYFDQCNQLPMCSTSLETYLDVILKNAEMLDKGLMTAEQVASDLQNKISLSLME